MPLWSGCGRLTKTVKQSPAKKKAWRNEDIIVRRVDNTSVSLLIHILRRQGRWRTFGLQNPPDDRILESLEVGVPAGVRRVHAETYWLCDRRGVICGLTMWYPWDAPTDRKYLLFIDTFSKKMQLRSMVRATLSTAPAGMLSVAVQTDSLAATVLPKNQNAAADFQHYTRTFLQEEKWIGAIEQITDVWQPLASDTQKFSTFFSIPTTKSGTPYPFELVIRDPSDAHKQLLLAGWPQRYATFPEIDKTTETDVLVVGAGVAGLAAAYALSPRKTIVLERGDRLGGTGAYQRGLYGDFPLGAHYECDLHDHFGKEILDLYQNIGLAQQTKSGWAFVDKQYYQPPTYGEQLLGPDGQWRFSGRISFSETSQVEKFREAVLQWGPAFGLPTRLCDETTKQLNLVSFADWLKKSGLSEPSPTGASYGMDVLLRSDYGAASDQISAFAGLHYFACRPYFTTGSSTFAPSRGLAYFCERLLQFTPSANVRLQHMVRKIFPRGDHVEVVALDLNQQTTRRFLAKAVVVASPKKALRYLAAADAPLFAKNRYAAWATVTMELEDLAERELLRWATHVYESSQHYVGMTWHNPAPSGPLVLSHYLVWPPSRWGHVALLTTSAQQLINFCFRQMARVVGRDILKEVKRITLQKFGHSMPTPLPHNLFFSPNARRAHERIVYAGVDTGRLPLLAEAIDSGLEAARELRF